MYGKTWSIVPIMFHEYGSAGIAMGLVSVHLVLVVEWRGGGWQNSWQNELIQIEGENL